MDQLLFQIREVMGDVFADQINELIDKACTYNFNVGFDRGYDFGVYDEREYIKRIV